MQMLGPDGVEDPLEPFYFRPIVDVEFSEKPFLPGEPLGLLKAGQYNKVIYIEHTVLPRNMNSEYHRIIT